MTVKVPDGSVSRKSFYGKTHSAVVDKMANIVGSAARRSPRSAVTLADYLSALSIRPSTFKLREHDTQASCAPHRSAQKARVSSLEFTLQHRFPYEAIVKPAYEAARQAVARPYRPNEGRTWLRREPPVTAFKGGIDFRACPKTSVRCHCGHEARRARVPGMKVRRIAILVYDGVETLDVAGPADVFFSANELLGREPAPYDIVVAGTRRGRIVAESGVCFYADAALSDRRLFDTIIIPGGKGVRVDLKTQAAVGTFLRKQARRARRIASVCTGIYGFAHTGLLDGRSVTTHWRYASEVQQRWPKLRVNADAIFIKDGNFYTSAGA